MEDLNKQLFDREFIEKWSSNYQKLEAFCKQNTTKAGDLDEELDSWVQIQSRIRHMLPGELKTKLSALNYDFESKRSTWEVMHRQLAAFEQKNGHTCLPDDSKHEALKDWLIRQVTSKELLSKSQFISLDSLGIDWDIPISRDHGWKLMFMRLKEFHQAFGHCRVPQRWAKDKQLALWVTVQRSVYTKGKLSEERHRMLQEIGFVWNYKTQFDAQWEGYFQELVAFRKTHGHCNVPGKHLKLVSWIERQRVAKTKKLLSTDRESRLNKIGFVWSFDEIKKENWEEKYRQLCAYKQKHGHSFVPSNYYENKSLGIWVASQRWLEAKGKLGTTEKKKLNNINFVWSRDTQEKLKSIYDSQWEANFEKLKNYRQKHGTCQVSLKLDAALQRWTCWQRLQFYQGKLSAERTSRLNEIRFPWSIQEGYWMRMYDALVEFRRQFGHTRVPSQWEPNPRLAAWAYRIRRDKKLTSQKVELLNNISFDWALERKKIVSWEDMYSRLLKFKQELGHTRVPVEWEEDNKLGRWVSRMRQERERLAPERVALLEAAGFDWGYRHAAGKAANMRATQICILEAVR